MRKLKGNQPFSKKPTIWLAQLEEEDADSDEDPESDDPDGIEGVMEEFMIWLARAVKYDTDNDNPLMYTQKAETLEPFSSHVIPIKTVKVYLGECINVMVQALHAQDGTWLLGLTVQNTYTELRKGGKKAVIVAQNNTAYLQTLQKKTPVARAVPALPSPEPPKSEILQDRNDTRPDFQTPKLTVRQRHGKIFHKLDLSSLDSRVGRCSPLAPCQIP